MLTAAELKTLSVDDVIETSPLFANLTPEKIKLRVREVSANGVKCVMLWCGITLGAVTVTATGGKVKWEVK